MTDSRVCEYCGLPVEYGVWTCNECAVLAETEWVVYRASLIEGRWSRRLYRWLRKFL